jgi:hypothetical protein
VKQALFRHSCPELQLLRQVPVLHSWQAPVQPLLQHLPSTQLPDWHWPPLLQLLPLASCARQVPLMQSRPVPPGQLLPEQQGWLLAPQGLQVPLMQSRFPPAQLLPAQQVWPLPPQAVQVPLRHSRFVPQLPVRFWQVPVLHSWQSPPQALLQQRPPTQFPDWHWPPVVHALPLPPSWRQLPPMQDRFAPPGQLLFAQQI